MKDALIIDVRENFEFISSHIRGALNIPLSSLQYEADTLKSKKRPLILYCKSGRRSGQAVGFLNSLGMEGVYNGGSVQEMVRRLDSLASLSI
jgi:phage shock protein E